MFKRFIYLFFLLINLRDFLSKLEKKCFYMFDIFLGFLKEVKKIISRHQLNVFWEIR